MLGSAFRAGVDAAFVRSTNVAEWTSVVVPNGAYFLGHLRQRRLSTACRKI